MQSPQAVQVLRATGVLRADVHHREGFLLPAYGWVEAQAARRLRTHGEHLLWAYAQVRSSDLRARSGAPAPAC